MAVAAAGAVGEEAPHSSLLLSAAGHELDVHISLPTLPLAGDRAWDVLHTHLEPLDLGVGTVPALDEPGRCLVLALHALNGRAPVGQGAEDLRRARRLASSDSWEQAGALAGALDCQDLFEAGLELVDDGMVDVARASVRARLYASSAPNAAFGLQRLAEARRRDRPGLLWREIFPSRGFMSHAAGRPITGSVALTRAHVTRWYRLHRELPSAFREWRRTRR